MHPLIDSSDTIAAIATAPGPGAIGVVRASGPRALAAATRVFSSLRGEPIIHRRVALGNLIDPIDGVAFDEALLTFFQGPNSYTRQDLIEISCHGGPAAVNACLRALLTAGCRLAQPGEFTLRAFMNGRIDLARAEAVADMVSAPNDLSLKAARLQLSGALSESVSSVRGQLVDLRAQLEAEIDFAEDDVPPMPSDRVGRVLADAQGTIAAALTGSGAGQLLRSGLRITLVGAPNAGKSSTLNQLLGRDRAIVTAIPGTTRDLLEESLVINGLAVVLTDTAGVRTTDDAIEVEGIERTKRALGEADLALLIVDAAKPPSPADRAAADLITRTGIPGLVLLNKSDLGLCWQDADRDRLGITPQVAFSAVTGRGSGKLKTELSRLVGTGRLRSNNLPQTTNLRHIEALELAATELAGAQDALERGLPGDFVCIGLAGAISALGQITGQDAGEDLLDAIFSKFCIGK